jgi:hypothetical protein
MSVAICKIIFLAIGEGTKLLIADEHNYKQSISYIESKELYERKSKETKYLCSFTTIDKEEM